MRHWDLCARGILGSSQEDLWGNKGCRIGQRETLNHGEVPQLRSLNDPTWSSRAGMALQECHDCVQGLCALPHIDQSLQVRFPQGGVITFGKGQFSERDAEICQQPTFPAAGQCVCPAEGASAQHPTTSTTPISKLLSSPQGPNSPLPHHEVPLTLYSLFSYLRYSHHTYKTLPGASSVTTEFRGHKAQNIYLVLLLKIPVNVENEKVIPLKHMQ